jgi:hypothetical protein
MKKVVQGALQEHICHTTKRKRRQIASFKEFYLLSVYTMFFRNKQANRQQTYRITIRTTR